MFILIFEPDFNRRVPITFATSPIPATIIIKPPLISWGLTNRLYASKNKYKLIPISTEALNIAAIISALL